MVDEGNDRKEGVATDSGATVIGAYPSTPFHILQPIPSKKGVNLYTGDVMTVQDDEGVFSMSPTSTTTPLSSSPTWFSNPPFTMAHDPTQPMDVPMHRSSSSKDMLYHTRLSSMDASSPTFTFSSDTPDTPVSFNFSPDPNQKHFPQHPDSRDSYFHAQHPVQPYPSSSYILARNDSLTTEMSEEPLTTPSTSYASSSRGPASFPYNEYIEIGDPKGKGKGKERAVPIPSTGAATDALRQDDSLEPESPPTFTDTGLQNDPEISKVGSPSILSSSPESISPRQFASRRSRIGLSFSDQRFIPSVGRHHAHFFSHRRSQSAHSQRRSPTPVPGESHSRSGSRDETARRQKKKQSIRRFFSLASRGRSFKRGKERRGRRGSTSVVPNIRDLFRERQGASSSGQASSSQPLGHAPAHSGLPNPHYISPVVTPTAGGAFVPQSEDAGLDDAASSISGSTTIKWSSRVPSVSAAHDEEGLEGEEPSSGGIVVASSSTHPGRPSILLSNVTGTAASASVSSPTSLVPMATLGVPEIMPTRPTTPVRPPKLKFVGRANTSPSVPQAVVSSAVAERTSTPNPQPARLSSPYYVITGPSVISPSNFRPHSNSVLTSVSGPDSSLAFTYIHTLPPLNARLIPQPDGCGQVLPEDLASPISAVSSTLASPVPRHVVKVDYFDTVLPYELRLQVFRTLIQLHVADHENLVNSNEWSVGTAAGTASEAFVGKKAKTENPRWVGFERGVRELVRIGRVCKAWRVLSLDGQLWASASFANFPQVPGSFLTRVTKSVGPFMKSLDLRGVVGITPQTMMDIVENIRARRSAISHSRPGSQQASEESDAEDEEMSTHSPVLSMAPYPSTVPSHRTSLMNPPTTSLTSLHLHGCMSIHTRSLHNLLSSSPHLEVLSLRGVAAVTNATCELIGTSCAANLVKLDLSRCGNMSASGVEDMIGVTNPPVSYRSFSANGRPRFPIPARRFPMLKEFKLSGLKRMTGQTMFMLGWGIPDLEVLDVSGARTLGDEDLEAFVRWDERFDDNQVLKAQSQDGAIDVEPYRRITLTSREMGLNPMSLEKYHRRRTVLRRLSLSNCPLLTDAAAGSIAYSVSDLEFFELGGIGAAIRDNGLIRLFNTTPWIRRLDLEDASEITDSVLAALVPPPPPPLTDQRRRDVDLAQGRDEVGPSKRQPHPGELLEEIILSYAGNLTDGAFLALIQGCNRLKTLEVDNTRASDHVVREFVKACRRRQIQGAEVVAVDCRNVTKSVYTEGLASSGPYVTRNRRGYRAWEARALGYYDERDKKDPMSGADAITGNVFVGDECDESRVILKTFHSWQAVDNMTAAREKRKKVLAATKKGDGSGTSTPSSSSEGGRTPRWFPWRSSGAQTPVGGVEVGDFDRGCVIM
ncbi:hypothetical protein FS837_009367 [Tulasnella sp. UAMH 9824]|nr:hypothetical protein FS837_009367 [Tulasnella sp. UAMH 9824]